MEYHVIDPRRLEPAADRPSERRSISEATRIESLGCHVFRADPGEQLPLAYHVHDEQEEVFVVLEGTLSVETPERTYAVDGGEAFVAEPGSPHRAFNDGGATEPVRALAVGTPPVDDVRRYEG